MMKIRPIGERLLLKLSDIDKYKGVLVIPENARQRVRVFEVVDKGEDVRGFELGEFVLVSFYTGIFIDLISNIELGSLRIVDQGEIIAKCVPEE